jgi:hypothetical protein
MWVLLRDAGESGCHSHDLRAQGISGNPSQRAKDIVSYGQAVWTAREARNGRPGSRYWLAAHAPDWAVPVRPNEPSSHSSPSDSNAAASATSSPEASPVGVIPVEEPLLEPLALVRDYTDPKGVWREVPVSELGLAA